jgi:predicted transcriptional regulator
MFMVVPLIAQHLLNINIPIFNGDKLMEEMRAQIAAGKLEAEDIIKCALGIRDLEVKTYFTLLEKPMQVQEIADKLHRNRSTIQRSLTNLISKGLATRRTKSIARGGYYYEYEAAPPSEVKKMVRAALDQWYEKMLHFLEEGWKKTKTEK